MAPPLPKVLVQPMFILCCRLLLPYNNNKKKHKLQGAAVGTLLTISFQVWLTIQKVINPEAYERMPVTVDKCEDSTLEMFPWQNRTALRSPTES